MCTGLEGLLCDKTSENGHILDSTRRWFWLLEDSGCTPKLKHCFVGGPLTALGSWEKSSPWRDARAERLWSVPDGAGSPTSHTSRCKRGRSVSTLEAAFSLETLLRTMSEWESKWAFSMESNWQVWNSTSFVKKKNKKKNKTQPARGVEGSRLKGTSATDTECHQNLYFGMKPCWSQECRRWWAKLQTGGVCWWNAAHSFVMFIQHSVRISCRHLKIRCSHIRIM